MVRVCKGVVESLKPVLIEQLRLVDKATSIAAAHDVAAYQGIQVMDQPVVGYPGEEYDPSDEAEFKREAVRYGQDPEMITDAEQEQLRDLLS